MFDLTSHNKTEAGSTGSPKRESGKMGEPLNKDFLCCPAVLTGLSREMRTQMNAIVAFAYMLNKKEYSENEKEDFSNQIYSSCEQIISMFDNFLDTAIIDTGNSITESGNYNPDKILDDLFSEFRDLIKKDKYKDLILVTESQPFNGSEYLIDVNRLTRVIRNLFQNALSNTKSGYIKIGYYYRNEMLTFSILDSGQGYFKCREFLQSQDMALSLLKFSDTCSAVNLGLTRKLVQVMEGSLWIEPNGLTGGSAISFTVPVSREVKPENNEDKLLNTISTF